MRNMIELTKLDTRRGDSNPFAGSDDPTEAGSEAANANQSTVRTTINANAIRAFYARRNDAPGTRITFTDGGGFVVTESYAEVKALIDAIDAPAA